MINCLRTPGLCALQLYWVHRSLADATDTLDDIKLAATDPATSMIAQRRELELPCCVACLNQLHNLGLRHSHGILLQSDAPRGMAADDVFLVADDADKAPERQTHWS